MRMWMVEPGILCRQHLLGEHRECHAFAGTLAKKMRIKGYIENNLLEPESLIKRHDALVEEMLRRGMNHYTELSFVDYSYLRKEHQTFKIDQQRSLSELLERCPQCTRNKQLLDIGLLDNLIDTN